VLATVMVAVIALVAQGPIDGFTAVASLVLLPAGFVFSHHRRNHRNVGVKVLLATALLAALGGFLARVRGAASVDDARAALAALFIWVQVLHSWDLPRRRDLAFSVVASLLLMAEAGSLSFGTGFVIFLVPYALLAGTWLYLSYRSQVAASAVEATVRVERGTRTRRAPLARSMATSMAVIAAATATAFLAMPRLPGALVVAPPMALTRRVAVPGFSGGVVNPGLPSHPGSGSAPFSPVAYPGYGDSIDLRVRGRLSDQVVLKVRAPQPAFWRGQVYDRFDGTTWTASKTESMPLPGGSDAPFVVPSRQTSSGVPIREVVQTFYVQTQQPNLVFAAYEPRQIYFPAPPVRVDEYGSLRSPILLEPGLVYSVISLIPVTTPSLLRSARASWGHVLLDQYTQLPRGLPDRVVRLAHQITDPAPTTYDKVMAVQRWLQVNTRYNLDIPPDPPGVDAVDYFLFHRRQGFCEHFSSAMAVLLRAVGIPTRFAVGFGPGEHNPFTGYYEVREADAHSWVEVNYPGVGWIEYDPTHLVPNADPGLGGRFIAPQVIAAIGRFLAHVIPHPVKRLAGLAGSATASLARHLARAWPVAVALAAAVGSAVLAKRRRFGRRLRGPPVQGAAAAFVSLCRTFDSKGLDRPPASTPSEYLDRLLSGSDLSPEVRQDVRLVIRAFEWERFSGGKLPGEEAGRALHAADRVADFARRGRRSLAVTRGGARP